MMRSKRGFAGLVAAVAVFLMNSSPVFSDDYDRLDGTGASGKRVNVIEWEGNLEIHVYPKGSLSGLAAVLDKKNKDKPVMVLGFRFDSHPNKQLIRRAILGIPIRENFLSFRDNSEAEFDKIILTNNQMASPLVAYQLDAKPTQLYPDGHPALAQTEEGKSDPNSSRHPANRDQENTAETSNEPVKFAPKKGNAIVDENGSLTPFFMNRSR